MPEGRESRVNRTGDGEEGNGMAARERERTGEKGLAEEELSVHGMC